MYVCASTHTQTGQRNKSTYTHTYTQRQDREMRAHTHTQKQETDDTEKVHTYAKKENLPFGTGINTFLVHTYRHLVVQHATMPFPLASICKTLDMRNRITAPDLAALCLESIYPTMRSRMWNPPGRQCLCVIKKKLCMFAFVISCAPHVSSSP